MATKFDPDNIIDYSIDYYAILGLEKGCLENQSRDEISKILSQAYTESAILVHPSVKGGDSGAFKFVVKAHTILSDDILRRCYDSGGKDRPRSVDDHTEYEIDWDKLGNYRHGTSADTIGFGLFFQISEIANSIGLVPAFYPEDFYHSYEWDWVIKGTDSKLSLSIVPDEDEVLRLTSGEDLEQALPFKIYICIPRNNLYFRRDKNEQIATNIDKVDVIKSNIISASYSDYNLKETTNLDMAVKYIESQLRLDILDFKDGTLTEKQFNLDVEAEQSQWIGAHSMQEHDIRMLKAILLSKSIQTKKDPHAADFLDRLTKTRQGN